MAPGRKEDASAAARESLIVLFLVVLFFLFGEITVLANLILFVVFFVFVFVIVIIHIFGDNVQMDGMDLRDFEFGLALWATQNLAFFDFVFVVVDLGGTFRAADHGSILRTDIKVGAARTASTHRRAYYIPS
jgi:hypothetical protein